MEATSAFVVLLREDMDDEGAAAAAQAIGRIMGVLSVEPHTANISEAVAQMRVRNELAAKLFEVLYPARAAK